MDSERELVDYVTEARQKGVTDDAITRALLDSGWVEPAIAVALEKAGQGKVAGMAKMAKRHVRASSVAIFCLFAVVIGLTVVVGALWRNRIDLSDKNNLAVRQFFVQLAQGSVGFTDAGQLVFPDDQRFMDAKQSYIVQKRDFVEADLTTMRLTMYHAGDAVETFPILSKGKEGSWWETPTGSYAVIAKEQNHFSSIGDVWMPWSIQFYGNFFIHGWPYYDSGASVPQGYSGGCIRLSTDDAKRLYDFVVPGTPILVHDAPSSTSFGTALVKNDAAAPSVGAEAFLIANIATGDTLIEKQEDKVVPIASLTKLMTAVVGSELVYLERSIIVRSDMLAAVIARFEPQVGDQYVAFDLLYPLLMQSSNQAANILAGFLGADGFISQMNQKSVSLGMNDTHFADVSGVNAGDTSSANNLFKLLQYIYFKRRFLFDITKGASYTTYSGLHTTTLANFNEFASDSRLVGMKNGQTTVARQTLASVWEFQSKSGPVPLAIIVLGSDNRVADTDALLAWVQNHVEFK